MPKRDISQLAKFVADQATGEVAKLNPNEGKNLAAVSLGRLGGLKGGKARALKLGKKRRSEIAKKAANSRWKKSK